MPSTDTLNMVYFFTLKRSVMPGDDTWLMAADSKLVAPIEMSSFLL